MMHLRQAAVFISLIVSMVGLCAKPPKVTEEQVVAMAALGKRINDFMALEKNLMSYERTQRSFEELKEEVCSFFDYIYTLNGYPAEWVSKHKWLSIHVLISKHNDTLMANPVVRPLWEAFKECADIFFQYEKGVKKFLAYFDN